MIRRALCLRIPSEARVLLSPEVFYKSRRNRLNRVYITTLDPSNNAQIEKLCIIIINMQLPSNKLAMHIGKQNIPGFLWGLQGIL